MNTQLRSSCISDSALSTEQSRIVAKVDQLMALCDELQSKLRAHDTKAERFAEAIVAELAA